MLLSSNSPYALCIHKQLIFINLKWGRSTHRYFTYHHMVIMEHEESNENSANCKRQEKNISRARSNHDTTHPTPSPTPSDACLWAPIKMVSANRKVKMSIPFLIWPLHKTDTQATIRVTLQGTYIAAGDSNTAAMYSLWATHRKCNRNKPWTYFSAVKAIRCFPGQARRIFSCSNDDDGGLTTGLISMTFDRSLIPPVCPQPVGRHSSRKCYRCSLGKPPYFKGSECENSVCRGCSINNLLTSD